jgi:hypothetical protein
VERLFKDLQTGGMLQGYKIIIKELSCIKQALALVMRPKERVKAPNVRE